MRDGWALGRRAQRAGKISVGASDAVAFDDADELFDVVPFDEELWQAILSERRSAKLICFVPNV